MPSHGQLEIIRANGEIEFYTLDTAAGITNIGRHPDNDIIIESTGVAPFHAILDHRQVPYLLILLSPEGQTRIGNEALVPHTPRSLQHWDNIEIDGHRLILVETEGGDTGQAPGVATPLWLEPSTSEAPQAERPDPALYAPVPARPASYPPPTTRPESSDRPVEPLYGSPAGAGRMASSTTAAVPTPVVAGMFDSLPADHEDEALIISLSEREWTINVEQTVTFQVTVTNGGPIVATFAIGMQGLDPSWVEISESQVNLFEGDRATVTISIRPPRLPSSRAGAHHFAVVVSSANYPGRYSRCGATVIINPYYQFGIGDLSPRRQTISWFRRFGTVTIPITNMGNSETHFRLDGADDERALSFEFDVPGEMVTLAKQAELRFSSEETISVPISITPHSRQLIGLRKRSYPYTITTSPLEGGQTPRSMLGELRSAPLIGPLWLLLLTLLFVFLLVWIVRPRLDMFMFADGGQTAEIQNGTPVAIRWRASFFTSNVAIDPPIEGLEQPLPRQGTVVAFPKESATYNLRGGNLLSDLASIFTPPTKAVQVDVTPIAPSVSFQADPNQVVGGEEEIVLSWTVDNADKIELFRQIGENGPIERLGDVSDQPIGSMRVSADPTPQNTIYILEASNVYVPTPTPVPQLVRVVTPAPEIIFFRANPQIINEGEEAILSWSVNGVREVRIPEVDGASSFPNEYELSVKPTGSTEYFLNVPGAAPLPARVSVIPATPTPTTTPEPDAPQIILFDAQPDELVVGDEDQVELSWQINQNFTHGEISSPDLGTIPFTDRIGSIIVTVKETTLFALTAFNGDKQSSTTTGVDVLTPTPTTTPPPTPIPPAKIEEFIIIAPGKPEVNKTGDGKYDVQKNTEVTFQWKTNNAANKVIFTEPGGAAEVGAVPVGQTKKTIIAGGNFTLVAENSAGQSTSPKQIEIDIVDQPPPNPPFNVNGAEDSANNENKITWNWTFDPAKSDATGFRVYRADVPPGTNYTQVAEIFDRNARDWTDDNPGPTTCGKAYYVVALYLDINGVTQESAVSTNTWFSTPLPSCP